ncbi:hypothetical protein E2C01_071178 [Portunus trituberculatus]|uniref:Uncharacterized protein n=1 Tax=Portunus trituberculatus TaxID=210409 RepID=A0A5B7HUP5_PORTR|nr:hypothetical protein [Portunus trituberculatus]
MTILARAGQGGGSTKTPRIPADSKWQTLPRRALQRRAQEEEPRARLIFLAEYLMLKGGTLPLQLTYGKIDRKKDMK